MGNIVLNDDLIHFKAITMDYVVDRDIIRSASGVLRFNTNTSARRVISTTLYAFKSEEKDYLRGVVQAAFFSNDSIELTLPPEVQRYTGTHSGNDMNLETAAAAGSNTVSVRLGTGTVRPAQTGLVQGEFISFGSNPTQYVINQYNAGNGQLVFHPVLRDTLSVSDAVNYTDLKFRGHITNTEMKEKFVAGNNNILEMNIIIEEII